MKIKRKLPPGTLIYTGDVTMETEITHFQYNVQEFIQVDDLFSSSKEHVDLITIEGLSNVEKIQQFCKGYNIDRLVIEDILNPNQRNKFESFDDHVFIILKYHTLHKKEIRFQTISMILFKEGLFLFTEEKNPFVEELKKRYENQQAMLSANDEDYLFYALYDMIIDEYINLIAELHTQIEEVEITILDNQNSTEKKLYQTHKNIVNVKNILKRMYENVKPLKINSLDIISSDLGKYFVDLDDHMVNMLDKISNSIESINTLFTLHSANLSNKMNTIMKTLTILSVIFIPLSFLAGVFGMNFVNFEFIHYDNGIYIFWGLCLLIVTAMIVYFKKLKWF